MPSKAETRFVCQECGQDYPRWSGQCLSCGAWNTLIEEQIRNTKSENLNKFQTRNSKSQKPVLITEVDFKDEKRTSTSIAEFDRVLGGGIVKGSAVLVSGDPGIGKSTLMLQAANAISQKVLYVSGEESAGQVRLRAERLGALSKTLEFIPETNLFAIEEAIEKTKPQLVIIDSIQTIFRDDLPSAPGSVAQVRECAAYLVRIAKEKEIPIFIVGHVTKEGTVAGPRILEHMVDTVLYFEGERHKQFRILRAHKNRFGSTNEIGIFEMADAGLKEVHDPSKIFLSERPEAVSGSVATAAIEGSRPLMVEVQALVSPTKMVAPRRTTTGVDYNRTSMLIAVLERRAGINLASQDIYVNIAGGVYVDEPAIDLPIAAALASCYKNKIVDQKTALIGEVGLAGEVRAVNQILSRVNEAKKLGFNKVIVPQGNAKELEKISAKGGSASGGKGIQIVAVLNLKEALTSSLQ